MSFLSKGAGRFHQLIILKCRYEITFMIDLTMLQSQKNVSKSYIYFVGMFLTKSTKIVLLVFKRELKLLALLHLCSFFLQFA